MLLFVVVVVVVVVNNVSQSDHNDYLYAIVYLIDAVS